MAEYLIRYQEGSRFARTDHGQRSGFYAESCATGQRINTMLWATEEQAIAEAERHFARLAAPAPAAAVATPQADRSAARVHRMVGDLGIDAPASRPTGRCHYCNLPLNRRGYCDECV